MEKKKITLGSVLVNLDAIITCVTLTLCTIVVNANVLMRYFLKRPLYWSLRGSSSGPSLLEAHMRTVSTHIWA